MQLNPAHGILNELSEILSAPKLSFLLNLNRLEHSEEGKIKNLCSKYEN